VEIDIVAYDIVISKGKRGGVCCNEREKGKLLMSGGDGN